MGWNMSFSQRMGIKPVKDTIQINSMDDNLRTSLWNVFSEFWKALIKNEKYEFSKLLWGDYFRFAIDELPVKRVYDHYDCKQVYGFIKAFYNNWKWYEVYDFLEFSVQSHQYLKLDVVLNDTLEKELSGYRFINKVLTPISDKIEIKSFEDTLNSEYKNVATHIETAIKLFSDRKNPNYRNSIKESISAVEAICNIVTGQNNATLGDALKKLGKNDQIHGQLQSGFEKLYAYTNDSKSGIRHFLLDEDTICLEDAKYMAVT